NSFLNQLFALGDFPEALAPYTNVPPNGAGIAFNLASPGINPSFGPMLQPLRLRFDWYMLQRMQRTILADRRDDFLKLEFRDLENNASPLPDLRTMLDLEEETEESHEEILDHLEAWGIGDAVTLAQQIIQQIDEFLDLDPAPDHPATVSFVNGLCGGGLSD